jgi:hypothetical protein
MVIRDRDLRHLRRVRAKVKESDLIEDEESEKVMVQDLGQEKTETPAAVRMIEGVAVAVQAGLRDETNLFRRAKSNSEHVFYLNRSHNTPRKLDAIRSQAQSCCV